MLHIHKSYSSIKIPKLSINISISLRTRQIKNPILLYIFIFDLKLFLKDRSYVRAL